MSQGDLGASQNPGNDTDDHARLSLNSEDLGSEHARQVRELQEALEALRKEVQDLEEQNRNMSECLSRLQPESMGAMVLKGRIDQNKEKIAEVHSQIQGKRRMLEEFKGYVKWIIRWVKEHPEKVKKASAFVVNIGCFIYKVRKSSQRQNLPSYAQREAYEVEEVREVNDILNPRFMSY